MLRLAAPTDPSWVRTADEHVPTLLLDHAHCEKKAASTAINLIFRYPDVPGLVDVLSPLAREELEHFELVLGLLAERDLPFTRLEPSAYAARLMKAARRGEPHRLVDTLLCCALIEARSCERMKLLAEGLSDPTLRRIYGSLLASEARHHQTYVDLAVTAIGGDREAVHTRLAELAAHEAEVLAGQDGPFRMHA